MQKQNNAYSVKFLKYQNGSWNFGQPQPNAHKDILKFLTYNVWFDQNNFELRMIEILKIIKNEDADFICLQEVTHPFFEMLKCDPHIQQYYYISNNSRDWYGTLILQKLHPDQMCQLDFQTQMSRCLLYSITTISNKQIYLACVHLESLDESYKLRQQQLQTIYKHMDDQKNVLIMGDFNYGSNENERNSNPNYIDTWPTIHKEPGYTMKETLQFAAWRPDKVLVKKSKLKVTEMRLVGDYDLDIFKGKQYSKNVVTTPSDHLGLVSVFQVQ